MSLQLGVLLVRDSNKRIISANEWMLASSHSELAWLEFLANLVCYILAQKCVIGVTRETARRQMGGKTGEWGEGPAGATVPYDVPGLHAARGANWTAARGYNAQKHKN